jgi:hypothetical protein
MESKAYRMCVVAVLLLTLSMVSQATASTMTYDVTFSSPYFDVGAPVNPVTGSFTITFDPTQTYTNATSVTMTSLNIALGSAPGFDYPYGAPDLLVVGGLENGVLGVAAGTNDFVLVIQEFTTHPFLSGMQLQYSQAGTTVWNTFALTGTVTAVPLPPTVLLLGSGLLGLVGWRRFRKS